MERTEKKPEKSGAKTWQEATQQKINKCLNDQNGGWQAAAERKINKCLDDQHQVEMKVIAHKKNAGGPRADRKSTKSSTGKS